MSALMPQSVFAQIIEREIAKGMKRYLPRVMQIASIEAGNRVKVKPIGGTALAESYPRIGGWEPSVNSWCLLCSAPGQGVDGAGTSYYVLPIVGSSDSEAGGGEFTQPVTIAVNDDAAFLITDGLGTAGTNARVAVDVVNFSGKGAFSFANGMSVRGYSDPFTTLNWEVDDTGDAIFRSVNTPLLFRNSASWVQGSRPSNSTATYANAITTSVTLPAGNWDIHASGWCTLYNAGNEFLVRAEVDGAGATARQSEISADDFLTMPGDATVFAKAGPDTFNCSIQYRPVTVGNVIFLASAQMYVFARRVS